MKRTAHIADYLQPLKDKPLQSYLTNTLQVADVLEWVLEQVGPAEVWQTSFSISEEFLRRLYFLQQRHPVKAFHLVLDHKATNKTLKLWMFIDQVIKDTYLADNHSKLILVKSSSPLGEAGEGACIPCVSIITSQNLTRGNRNESALVTTDPQVFATLYASVIDLIENHAIPISDRIREAMEGGDKQQTSSSS